MSTINSTWIGRGSKLCSVLILNITNNKLKYIIRKLCGNIIVPFNVIKLSIRLMYSEIYIHRLPMHCHPTSIVNLLWSLSDTLKTLLQLLFPTFTIRHLLSLQKQWIEVSLYIRYWLENDNTDWKYISCFMELERKKNCGSRKKYCIKSGKHKKLVTLIKMCFKASYNKVCIGNMYLMHFLIGMV